MTWLVWLRAAPLPGCKVTPESGTDVLECALEADAKADVRALLDAALHPHRYRVCELESCIALEPSAWNEHNDPGARVRNAAAAARERGGVHFAPSVGSQLGWGDPERGPLRAQPSRRNTGTALPSASRSNTTATRSPVRTAKSSPVARREEKRTCSSSSTQTSASGSLPSCSGR